MTFEELYDKLSRVYSTPYPDTEEERRKAIELLRKAYTNEKVEPEKLIRKMKELAETKGNFKSKLYNEILSKYWQKSFSETIQYKPFNLE